MRGAIRGGWLKNSESRRGYPACLSRGEPLPEEKSALPEVDEVRRRFEQHSNGHSNTAEGVGRERDGADAFERSSDFQPVDERDDEGFELYPDEGEPAERKP